MGHRTETTLRSRETTTLGREGRNATNATRCGLGFAPSGWRTVGVEVELVLDNVGKMLLDGREVFERASKVALPQ
eukprot:2739035-Prymnesium_polylepis.1